jgi:hypothetical protein
MKNLRISSFIIFALLFASIGFISCNESDDIVLPDTIITLTGDEISNLKFMREEEKLARDVYLYFYEKYELNIFNNIASSEQTHMDAVLTIMEEYGLEDSATNENGVFNNVELQELYDVLILQGDVSLIDALIVGATIEDVDIRDLDNAIKATSKTDIIEMYDMLNCGSRNHMRGFISQLDAQGENYTPQFITPEKYEEIINGEHEQCGQ